MRYEKRYARHVLEAVGAYKKTLDDHRANGDSVQKLCRQYGVTRNTMQNAFQHQYGIHIRFYKLNIRLERGRIMLKAGRTVKAVSILLHYTTPRAFVTAFKKKYGITPGRYAEQYRLL
jgi:AraC-like DNA-binding protein